MASKLLHRFEGMPPAKWEKAVYELTPDERHHLYNELEDLAQWSTTLASYVSNLTEQGHDEAVKLCMKRRVAVRRALGYSYPKAGTFTF